MEGVSMMGIRVISEPRTCDKHGDYTAKAIQTGKGAMPWSGCPVCAQAEAEASQKAKEHEDAQAKLLAWRTRVNDSGIPPRFQDRRFDNYEAETPEQANVLQVARAYAKDWPQVRKSGRCLVFVGSVGTGKTHLACAIAAYVMYQHGATFLFRTVQQAVRSVRDTWVKGSGRSESEAVARLVEPELLCLDEIGVQSGSEWEKQILFDVLNERYQQRKPTMLLTNLMDEELPLFLGERVIDRLREDGGEIVALGWESWRKKKPEN